MVIFGLKDRPRDYLALGVIKLAARLGLAPRSPRLTGAPLTLADLAINWSGISVTLRVISWSQARRISFFLMPDGGWRRALSPNPSGSLCFQDRPGAVVQFTIHKMVIPARIALAASSFAGKRSSSTELRDSWWRITVSRRTLPGAGRSCHILSLIPQKVAPSPGLPPGSPALEVRRSCD